MCMGNIISSSQYFPYCQSVQCYLTLKKFLFTPEWVDYQGLTLLTGLGLLAHLNSPLSSWICDRPFWGRALKITRLSKLYQVVNSVVYPWNDWYIALLAEHLLSSLGILYWISLAMTMYFLADQKELVNGDKQVQLHFAALHQERVSKLFTKS